MKNSYQIKRDKNNMNWIDNLNTISIHISDAKKYKLKSVTMLHYLMIKTMKL